MGGHEGWAQPNGFSPNGLLPNEAASVTRALDQERLSLAEERTKQLIACIQPNQPSEERREAVASYVKSLIMKCFSCKVPISLLLFLLMLLLSALLLSPLLLSFWIVDAVVISIIIITIVIVSLDFHFPFVQLGDAK